MSQRWRAVGNTVSDLTGPRFEPQTSRSREERVTARPTGRYNYNCLNGWKQSRSQDFAKKGGGAFFLKFDLTVNELDPNFHLVSIGLRQIQSVFLPKSSDLQKKVFTEIQSVFLSTDTHFYFSFHDLWGGYFRLGGGYFPF